ASGAPLASGCLPSYVLVESDGTLPAVPVIRIAIEGNDNYPILDASATAKASMFEQMATMRLNGNTIMGSVFSRHIPIGYYYFRGLRFIPKNDQLEYGFFEDLSGGGAGSYGYENNANFDPDHLVFQQCVFDCDPEKIGRSGGLMGAWTGYHVAFINCLLDNFFIPAGG